MPAACVGIRVEIDSTRCEPGASQKEAGSNTYQLRGPGRRVFWFR